MQGIGMLCTESKTHDNILFSMSMACTKFARNTMGVGQTLAEGTRCTTAHATSKGIALAKNSPLMSTARGTTNSPWKRQALLSRAQSTLRKK